WTDKVRVKERDHQKLQEDARARSLRIEEQAAVLGQEKRQLEETRQRLESDLRKHKEEAEADAKRLKDEAEALAKKAKDEKDAGEKKLAELKKDTEAKLKTLDTQLRDERKKTVDLEAKYKELENRSVWQFLKGGKKPGA